MNGLKEYMTQTGATLRAVARMTDVPWTTVYRHSSGLSRIPADTAIHYNRILGIPLPSLRPDIWGRPDHTATATAKEVPA